MSTKVLLIRQALREKILSGRLMLIDLPMAGGES